jgi:hypothetical protein
MARLLASRHHCDGQLFAIGVRTSSSSVDRVRSCSVSPVRSSSSSRPQYRLSASAPSTYAFCASSIRRTSGWEMIGTCGLAGSFALTGRPCGRPFA